MFGCSDFIFWYVLRSSYSLFYGWLGTDLLTWWLLRALEDYLLSQSFAHPCLNPPVLHLISFPQLWTSVISLSSVKYFELSPCHRAQCSFVLIVWNLKNNSAFTIFLWTCWCPSPAYSSSSWSLGPFGLLGPTIPGGILEHGNVVLMDMVSGHDGDMLVVGVVYLRGLFQYEWFCDFLFSQHSPSKHNPSLGNLNLCCYFNYYFLMVFTVCSVISPNPWENRFYQIHNTYSSFPFFSTFV